MADRTTIVGQDEGGLQAEVTTITQLTDKINSGKSLSRDESKQLKEIVKLLHENNEYASLNKDERKAIQKELTKQTKENTKNWTRSFKDSEKNFERLNKALSSAFQKIDTHIKTYTDYAIKVNAALDGTQKTYSAAVENLTSAIGSTGLAEMSNVLTKMSSLTEKGIIANVEQNAFLMSIKDGIASTFDAANGTLLRLIKLQGEDSTTNRLVMQASLKEYLNQTYQNSQYLYEQFDTVSNNLLEATSLLTSSLGNSLEATVQKWLGSLSSMGLSDQAVSKLSSAIGAVGSGNLKGIDENMQNLVIMGANRAGLSYSDLLTGGLTSEDTDKLMYGMINYLGNLAGNNVVMSEYANIFGVSVSDLKAARNAQSQLESIMGTTVSSDGSDLGKYLARYNAYLNASPATLYDTLFENMLFGMGANVASNRTNYSVYKLGGLIGGITGSMGLTGVAGNLINLIGPAMQLTAAMGMDDGKLSLAKLGSTLKGLGTTFGNLWADPNSILAYNMLSGANLATGTGILADVGTGATAGGVRGASTGTSSSASSGGSSPFGEGGSVMVAISESMEALEEAQSARTADDLYEFLSTDTVMVTPYVNEGNILTTISSYNKTTAENTAKTVNVLNIIEKFMREKLGPYLIFESMNEGNSLIQAASSPGATEEATALYGQYQNWLGGFGG